MGIITHGHCVNGTITRIYRTWVSLRTRCNNPNYPGYKNWGGRGIKVCDRWSNSFKNFLEDMGKRPKGKSIERIDNNGNYEMGNCRWATRIEQSRNKKRGKTLKLNPLKVQIIKKLLKESKLKQWEISEIFGVDPSTISFINTGTIWGDISYKS